MSGTVYLSNVPPFCQEQDVYRALLPFGSATDVQINRQNNSALVTMRTPHEAQALRNQHTVNIMGSMVAVNTGGMPQPMQPHQHQQQHQQSQPAPQQQQQQPYGGGGGYQGGIGSMQPQGSLMGSVCPRLRFVVENCTYPITRPLLMQLFNMVAPPTHVYCGPSGPTTSGDVEFQDQPTADRVLQELNNKFIYPDCCLMRLYYDQQQPPRMPLPPPPQQQQPPSQPPMGMPIQQHDPQAMLHQRMSPPPMNQGPYGNYDPMMGANMQPRPPQQQQQQQQQQQHQQQQMQHSQPPMQQQQSPPLPQGPMGMPYGGNQPPYMYDGPGNNNNNQMNMLPYEGGNMGPNNNDMNNANMMMPPPGPGFRGGRGGRGCVGAMMMRGRGGRGDGMMFDPMGGPGQGYGPGPAGFVGGGRGGGPGDVPPPVQQDGTVMVANVEETVPLYDLWVLLEVYGNVNSLKRMFREKSSVVAQFQHPVDARNAVFNLHGCRFRGHTLSLKHFAGYVERGRVEWNAGPATDPNTLAVLFTSGYHHRTKPNAPFNAQGRVHPEKYLYISNLTGDISDSTVKDLLSSTKDGKKARDVVKFLRKNETAAIAEFKDVETSVDALIASHAHQLKDRYLRITFSRHPPEPRVAAEKEEETADTSACVAKPEVTPVVEKKSSGAPGDES